MGSSWTNLSFDVVTTLEGYETITVPAGTFTNCIRYHRRQIDAIGSETGTRFWVKPGLIDIKEISYVDEVYPPEAAPVVRELESWSDE